MSHQEKVGTKKFIKEKWTTNDKFVSFTVFPDDWLTFHPMIDHLILTFRSPDNIQIITGLYTRRIFEWNSQSIL